MTQEKEGIEKETQMINEQTTTRDAANSVVSTGTYIPFKEEVKEVKSWLQKHERLIIVFMVLVTAIHLGLWTLNTIASYDSTRAAIAESALQQAQQTKIQADVTAAKDAAILAQVQSQYQAMLQTAQAQNAALQETLTERDKALAQQKGTDASLPLSGLAGRIGMLANAPLGSISVDQTHVLLTQSAALATAQALESVPVLQKDLVDETQIAANTAKELSGAQGVIMAQSGQITDLKTAVADDKVVLQRQVDADKKELTAVKAKARKSKIKAFFYGVGVGFGGALAVVIHGV